MAEDLSSYSGKWACTALFTIFLSFSFSKVNAQCTTDAEEPGGVISFRSGSGELTVKDLSLSVSFADSGHQPSHCAVSFGLSANRDTI